MIILCFVCPITLEHDGSGFFLICLGPLFISPLIDICRDKCCNYYNADIIMVDNLLKIKRRAWCKRNTKIYFPGQITEIKLEENKLYFILNDNTMETLIALQKKIASEEIDYFLEVVNDYIKNKMKN